ncbi:1-acyl-sn-glycerol-3-phosphate acyltransferase {ECO:0000256/RuleBase:RU361267} {ECO:0000256/RuleBase:RU361267} [Serendipita indica DSM 11827]|nr:1-acyl-sn-glycerol-3-phosphate acyltransferase {ECO:0000256/RuleBase:RU361267} {ECO:0000256/RuleBase:RU361267} [Serendipita indica DSM 11827]
MGLLYASIVLSSSYGILVSLFCGAETNYISTKAFADVCEWTVGLKFEVEGKEHLDIGPSVVVYNHQSLLDIVFIGRAMPRRSTVLAKKELNNAIFVDRSSSQHAQSLASLHKAAQQLLFTQSSLLVFPEGTRTLSKEHNMRTFKKGAFHVAIEAGVPIVPVVCENHWRIYRPGVFNGGMCKISVLPPISTKGLSSADATRLSESTRNLMLAELNRISQ